MLYGTFRQEFEELHATGMQAKSANNHIGALSSFEAADLLADAHDDDQKRLDALQPAARALWTMGQYDEASSTLGTAANIANELGRVDEQGIIISNIGRIALVKTITTVPIATQAQTLQTEAVPHFKKAMDVLSDHPHLYFRYANAQHGSLAAAMAGERRVTVQLIREGATVAFQISPEPYDQKRTYKINPRGLVQLLAATALIPFGNKTPVLAKFARTKLVG